MDLDATLLSPLWWASVALAGAALAWLVPRVLGRLPALRSQVPTPSTSSQEILLRALRLRTWQADLLIVANASMMAVLAAGTWRHPSLAGPLGLACAVLSLSSLALAWQLHLAAARIRRASPAADGSLDLPSA